MEDFSKIREEKNKNMSFEEYKSEVDKSIVKEGKFSKFMSLILFWPIHAITAILGIDKDSAISNKLPGHGGQVTNTPTSSSAFRQEHHFDPERAYIERMQERAYFQMVDGRGDSEHCDCDHDR